MRGAVALAAGLALAAASGAPASASAAPAAAPGARAAAAPAGGGLGPCAAGRLCLWQRADFRGTRYVHELADTDIESCVPLPAGASAASLVNRTGRPVTTYQSAECAETGEFDTYPGGGTWVPRSPYQVRAFKIWES
ncbi:peptidase inhibitor family I36 protein [Streptomyces sp. URMC 123]|uniref:peptidase inhibitor family I36 protein n=1 Tax=Streptomyces sp. URMC 123 TaxID=3423403 RepID=UPI003F19A3E2